MSTNIHSAEAPMLGYRFQSLYALLVLWKESEEDFDKVSVETDDDITLKGSNIKLYQLKHSIGKPKTISLKNDGLWKTIRIWAKYADSPNHELYFVTADWVKESNSLFKLVNGDLDRNDLVSLMVDEAKLVINARNQAIANKEKNLPYENRIEGCLAFMRLSTAQQLNLMKKITVRPNTIDIYQVQDEVINKLSDMAVSRVRPLIAERLLQWWDKRMLDSKTGISKMELLFNLQCLIAQFQDNNLPDDYSEQYPESIEPELGGFMEKQIDLVKGGTHRKNRAAVARWRARNQRERWIQDDLLYALELEKYDEKLQEVWADWHGPMRDDMNGQPEDICEKEGLSLLDWIHKESHLHINPIRSEWKQHFLIQGTYQQLAEELRVGWHPFFKQKLTLSTKR
ncbi:ABC-three component system protein [Paenibacillus chitinolyticus]|uniref:ABC-three component system protein n=1 Tax=Paenibacillus chitinolyticus TaxID=79263 RepID=UPI003671D37B